MTNIHPTLEAVARAICIAAGFDPETCLGFYLPKARAALNALREDDVLAKAVVDQLREAGLVVEP